MQSNRVFVHGGQRQSGKTTWLMGEVYDYVRTNGSARVVVSLPTYQALKLWSDMWRSKYTIPVPKCVVATNTLPVRGFPADRVFIDEVNWLQDGIYDEKVMDLAMCLANGGVDAAMIMTYTVEDP